jgi:hypothetical protein
MGRNNDNKLKNAFLLTIEKQPPRNDHSVEINNTNFTTDRESARKNIRKDRNGYNLGYFGLKFYAILNLKQ